MPNPQSAPLQDSGPSVRSDRSLTEVNAPPRVLVVDDDPGTQLLLRETLAKAGFVVSVAASGPEAIERCLSFLPDLVLLDINMPSMDGFTACAEIRKQNERSFPIIMVTSVDDAVSIQRAFDAGATDFILKPVNWLLFQRRLDSVLLEWNRTQELDESNKRVELLEKVAPEQVMLVSRSGVIIEDLKHRQESGPAVSEPRYATLDQVFGANIARRFKQRISGVLKTRRHNNLEFTITENGMSTDYQAQFLIDGRDRVIVVIQNVSSDKESQTEIYNLAYHDSATDLPNRHLFERRIEEVLVDASLHGRHLVFISLCFEGLSEEDLVNRDIMLYVVSRLGKCLKNPGGLVRVGEGDSAAVSSRVAENRFMLTLAGPRPDQNISTVCDQIAAGFAKPIDTRSGSITITPRLGVATYPFDGGDFRTMMQASDSAMQEARETGDFLRFNSQTDTTRSVGALDYGSELRRAMDDGQLELYFQPRQSMPDGGITCVEALLRWNHPMRGFVGLRELLHLAKATGLIMPLGEWVLQTACEHARSWRGNPAPRVSINLSQQEFARHDLCDRVIEILDRTDLNPEQIELELTEAALLRTSNGVSVLEALKEIGVGLVLDDFGSGHSSLSCLRKYPIDALKIDGSFVRDLPENEDDAAVCEVIITMAHKLGMKAVAEGVESAAQLDYLRVRGCDEFQGFHICKPLPADEIEAFLRESSRTRP